MNLNFLVQLASISGAIVVLVVILVLAKGRAKVLGSIGVLLIMVNAISSMVFNQVYVELLSQVASADLPPVLLINTVVQTLLYGAGVILLGLSVAAGRPKKAPAAV